jgi:ABC-2 type transport system permease protein
MNWAQLRGMLWLRWRLTRNQWRRSGQLNAVITLIAVILALGLAAIGGLTGIAGGALGLSEASPRGNVLVRDGLVLLFLSFWTIGVVTDLQRSEMLDLSRLLLLPISLRDVFLLNYLSSHVSLSLAMVLPVMLGLSVGLVIGRGVTMVLLFPLVFGFFFMITAWTYCLRGWLASLMVNKRRRRAIIMGVTMTLVLAAQLPNLVTNVWLRGHHVPPPQNAAPVPAQPAGNTDQTAWVFHLAHRYVPVLWLPYGARSLAEGRAWPAIWGACGMFVIGAWGLAQAYRSTLRFYLGGNTGKTVALPPAPPKIRGERKILVERKIPAVPEEAGALALASLRSLSRAPEVKMALATNVLIFIVLGAGMVVRHDVALPAAVRPFVPSCAVAVTFLGLVNLMFNHFGFDRSGFRAIVLLPAPRRHILLGKNLALLPVAAGVFTLYLGLAVLLVHLTAWDILLGIIELAAAFLAASAMGNIASIFVPYRIAAGTLKPTKTDAMTKVLIFATGLLFPLAMAPVFLPPGLGLLCGQFDWLPAGTITLACALALAAFAALLYWQTLEPLGRLMQQREQRILQVVTQEVE